MSRLRQGTSFVTGLRRLLRETVGADAASSELADRSSRRLERFLVTASRTIGDPSTPYGELARHAGVSLGDVREIAGRDGLERALVALRDAGVFVSYEEFRGLAPARRGSATFEWRPEDFRNRDVRADYMGGTSGSRSGSVPVARSFDHLRNVAPADLVYRELWGVADAPGAVWLPVLPSSAGLNNVLVQAVTGNVPERWFSHVPPGVQDISPDKRVANRVLPGLGRLFGVRLPRPEHADAEDPSPVLEWATEALAREGRALLVSYPSSAVALAAAAGRAGASLDGLVVRLGGEPATAAKVASMEAVGMRPANCYAFAQLGRVAAACPWCDVEELHVLEHDVAVVGRRRAGPDGAQIDAFCWTSLAPTAPALLLNVENDDYGVIRRDVDPCRCAFGHLSRHRIAEVRGVSKVVAGGVTLGGDVLQVLVESMLPDRFGGSPVDYQFTEREVGGVTSLSLRMAPRIGPVDEEAVAELVIRHLRSSDLGVLADEVWRGAGAPMVTREAPRPSKAGKIFAFEPLAAAAEETGGPGA